MRKTLGRLTAVAVGLAVVGCGGSDATPNPGLDVPKSSATMEEAKAGRGGGLTKQPAKK